MKISVQSRGLSQDDDYCWQGEAPVILRTNRINDLIQSESPSVVLARYDGELLLLVTGLESRQRTDFRGRIIRNSVAWVGKDSEENEQKLRAIAASALRDLLKDDIDNAVTFGGENGFEVDFDAIDQLKIEKVRIFETKSEKKIGKNSQSLKDVLAYEIEERCLPKGNGFNNTPLLVVTGIKSEDALKQAGVWRGLSNLVQGEDWKEYKFPFEETDQKNTNQALISGFVVIISVAIILLLLFQQKPKPNQETQSIPQPVSASVEAVNPSLQADQVLENKTSE